MVRELERMLQANYLKVKREIDIVLEREQDEAGMPISLHRYRTCISFYRYRMPISLHRYRMCVSFHHVIDIKYLHLISDDPPALPSFFPFIFSSF